jgi:hypothetical protein
VVRGAEEHDRRVDVGDLGADVVGIEVEVGLAPTVDPGAAGSGGDQRMHRVRRGEAEGHPAGAGERLNEVLQHLVGAVARPDLVRGHRTRVLGVQVSGEIGSKVAELTVGVAVQATGAARHRGQHRSHHRLGQRVGVLVGVQTHRYVELRRPVGDSTPKVVAQRQVGEVGHGVILSGPGDQPSGCAPRTESSSLM